MTPRTASQAKMETTFAGKNVTGVALTGRRASQAENGAKSTGDVI